MGNTSGRQPTSDEMIRVLSHLTSLRIRAKWTTLTTEKFSRLADIALTVSSRCVIPVAIIFKTGIFNSVKQAYVSETKEYVLIISNKRNPENKYTASYCLVLTNLRNTKESLIKDIETCCSG